MLKSVDIYTDGACSGNPGPGGWGAVLLYGNKRRELSGYEPETTNQRMELQAAVEALSVLKEICHVDLYSDSAYLINAWQQNWLTRWHLNNWQTAKKTPVSNKDLWEKLWALSRRHEIVWHKVPGHADNLENNRCDELARQAISDNK